MTEKLQWSLNVQLLANDVGNFKAENLVISLVQMQQTNDAFRRNVVVEFPQKFTRVSVSTVEIGGGKLDVCAITEARYLAQNVLGVVMKCLVMTDEVVLDVTRLTEIILRLPVMVDKLFSRYSFVQNVLNELFEFHVVSSL